MSIVILKSSKVKGQWVKMKDIIHGILLGSITIYNNDELTTLTTDYMPEEFILNCADPMDNIRKDIIVKTFKVSCIRGRLPEYLRNRNDIENIIVLEKRYNEYNTPVYCRVSVNKYIIGDCFCCSILLPYYFRVRNYVVISAKK